MKEPEVAIAERIARAAHAGQLEKLTGDLYIHHVERVVAMVSDQAKPAAWLHDVVEDTATTMEDLIKARIRMRTTIKALMRLTRWPVLGQTYAEYIEQCKLDPIAREVKIADLKDHLRPNCPESLRARYEKALARLEVSAATRA